MQTSKNVGIKQSIIPEFISGSSTQAVTQEKQSAWKPLNKFQGLSYFITPRGFTLIEVLVVVLIIGVLAAIALPMYNKAVLRSRFNALMPIVKAMNDSNEAYFLEHGSYASNPQDLPVQGLSEYPTGTELELGSNMDYAYVLASNSSAKNNYIMYQKHSTNYPGEIHCEAITGDDLSEYICVSAGGTTNLGTTLTEGYTTYVLSGSGTGVAPGTFEEAEDNANPLSCDKAIEMGFTCTVDEENRTKKVCTTSGGVNYCRTKTYNEDGSYTSVTCSVNSNGVCTASWISDTYDENGNKLSERACARVDSSGTCIEYTNSAVDYTYDANGNMLTRRSCSSVDSSTGNCTAYNSYNNYDYTYDANGNMLTQRYCSSVDSSGKCTEYNLSYSSDYTYDADGNKVSQRKCSRVDSNGNCTAYGDGYDYTYDANGHTLTESQCGSVDSSGNCTWYKSGKEYTHDANGNRLTERTCRYVDSSTGKCTSYESPGYDYTYDANGNRLTQRYCSSVDNSGTCTAYWNGQSYDNTYDENGNRLMMRQCSTIDSSGTCTAYSRGYDYTYDANGNQLTQRECYSVASSGNCTAYTTTSMYDYTYDANGNKLTQRKCSSVDVSTGNCTAYAQGSNSGNYDYTYDDNGNMLTNRTCSTVDVSTGNCTVYGGTSYKYVYDENGKGIASQSCSGSNLNTTTGDCTVYSTAWVSHD